MTYPVLHLCSLMCCFDMKPASQHAGRRVSNTLMRAAPLSGQTGEVHFNVNFSFPPQNSHF